jgi:hypothetical protein
VKTAKTKQFTLDLNLDDKEEVDSFILLHGRGSNKAIAKSLGLRGKGSVTLASKLLSYAWNKKVAIFCREKGDIESAVMYENICECIYSKDIAPTCNCW